MSDMLERYQFVIAYAMAGSWHVWKAGCQTELLLRSSCSDDHLSQMSQPSSETHSFHPILSLHLLGFAKLVHFCPHVHL